MRNVDALSVSECADQCPVGDCTTSSYFPRFNRVIRCCHRIELCLPSALFLLPVLVTLPAALCR